VCAQALTEGVPIIGTDTHFSDYGVQLHS